jgi:methylated-DNA-[protein]-cysteine S-methyltransferase
MERTMNTLEVFELDSPVGPVCGALQEGALVALDLGRTMDVARIAWEQAYPECAFEAVAARNEVPARLRAYFDGDVRAIDALAVRPKGTEFQRKVWSALRKIPGGQTWSYRQLAISVGQPTATRAVGAANGKNPVGLVIPCHRVIASDGTLGGYAGGLERKTWLLRHERVLGVTAQLELR